MSDQFDFKALLASTSDSAIEQVTSDVDNIQAILTTSADAITQEQKEVTDAMDAEAAAANTVSQQDAELANLLLDERLANDAKLAKQWRQFDQMADPVEQARMVQKRYNELQTASDEHSQNVQDSNSINPLVGIPATFKAMFSEAALQGATANLKLQTEGFNEIQQIRAAALSNYQTRSQLYTQERVDSEKRLNVAKTAHAKLSNNTKLETKDLEFAMNSYNIAESQRDSITKVLNAKLQGKQLQLATVQAEMEATMMPYRLEQMQLETDAMKDNTEKRKAIEAQFALKYPDQQLRPNWQNPSVQASMSTVELARLQEVITSSKFGSDNNSYSAAVVSAQTGTSPQAVEYVAMAEEMRDAYNSQAYKMALEADPLSAQNFVQPLDPKDPLYRVKMDSFMKNQQTIAEQVDGSNAIDSGYVALESVKTLIQNGELDLAEAERSGVITAPVRDLLETGDFDLIMTAGGSAGKQAATSVEQMFNAANSITSSKGTKYTSADLAQGFTLWSQFALQRSNASPNTAMNLNRLTIGKVDAFSSKTGLFQRYELESKPLDVTDINQVMARFDSLSKRRAMYQRGKDAQRAEYKKRTAGATSDEVVNKGVTDYSPYGWMNIR